MCIEVYSRFFQRVTRSMTKAADDANSGGVDLCDTVFTNPDLTDVSCVASQEIDQLPLGVREVFERICELSLFSDKLIAAQNSDSTLAPLYELVQAEQDVSRSYFLKNGILMRQWVGSNSSDA